MTDTINDVAAETGAQDEPAVAAIDEQGVAEQLVAQAREKGIELVGPNGLLSQLTKRVLETALEVEMTDHLGYDKHDPVGRNRGNSRNGVRSKTVLTEIGPVEIEVPRDLDASFTPTIVKKRQRRLTGVDQIVLSLSARGLTTGEISAHFAEVYGASVSKETVSKISGVRCCGGAMRSVPPLPQLMLYLTSPTSGRGVWPCQRRFDLVSPTGFEPVLPP